MVSADPVERPDVNSLAQPKPTSTAPSVQRSWQPPNSPHDPCRHPGPLPISRGMLARGRGATNVTSVASSAERPSTGVCATGALWSRLKKMAEWRSNPSRGDAQSTTMSVLLCRGDVWIVPSWGALTAHRDVPLIHLVVHRDIPLIHMVHRNLLVHMAPEMHMVSCSLRFRTDIVTIQTTSTVPWSSLMCLTAGPGRVLRAISATQHCSRVTVSSLFATNMLFSWTV